MIAKNWKSGLKGATFALAAFAVAASASAQTAASKAGQAKGAAASPAQAQGGSDDEVKLVQKVVPVKPSDPVAVVNNEIITRAQLADEALARKGEEILETLIARKLIEQAVRGRKIEITAAEIDAEIERIARQMAGLSREDWLRTLSKERGISPMQYRRDIIYPALALRQLAAPRVVVTDKDIQKAFDSKYGDKLRVRMIMVKDLREGSEIWNYLQKNPGSFERIASTRSRDETTRANGGMFGRPLSRHEVPENLSNAAFAQLVDGNPSDKDAAGNPIKPKDGDITGPIQVGDENSAYIILKREGHIPPVPNVDRHDPAIHKEMQALMYEAMLNQQMESIYQEMMESAKIENLLTGRVNTVRKNEQVDVPPVDNEVKQMSQDPKLNMRTVPAPAGQPAAASSRGRMANNPNPIGVSEQDKKSIEGIRKSMSNPPANPSSPADPPAATP